MPCTVKSSFRTEMVLEALHAMGILGLVLAGAPVVLPVGSDISMLGMIQ